MHRTFLISLVLLFSYSTKAAAALVAYEFSGVVTFSSEITMPYGIDAELGTPVSGRFAYDLGSAMTHSQNQGAGYAQSVPEGFVLSLGDTTLAMDSYLVEVADNAPQASGGVLDIFSVRFSSVLTPPLVSPLTVDGTPQTSGILRLDLLGPPNLFNGVSLPQDIELGDFFFNLGLLAESTSGQVDIRFTIDTLTSVPVPEPSSVLLMFFGGSGGVLLRNRLRFCT